MAVQFEVPHNSRDQSLLLYLGREKRGPPFVSHLCIDTDERGRGNKSCLSYWINKGSDPTSVCSSASNTILCGWVGWKHELSVLSGDVLRVKDQW